MIVKPFTYLKSMKCADFNRTLPTSAVRRYLPFITYLIDVKALYLLPKARFSSKIFFVVLNQGYLTWNSFLIAAAHFRKMLKIELSLN